MAALDLKPLSKETIEEMGYSDHDLWVVRIDEDLYGPFEAESLKHYAKENETLFENADACRLDNNNWSPFYKIEAFKNIEHVKDESKGPFWILTNGLKSEPLSFNEIEKKIELGILTLTDAISVNDGHTWKKVFQIECFSHHGQNSDVLPARPLDIEPNLPSAPEKYSGSEQLAALMFIEGKNKLANFLNLDELDLKSLQKNPINFSFKFLIPLTVASIAGIVFVTSLVFTGNNKNVVELSEEVKPETMNQRYNTSAVRLNANQNRAIRMPASVSGYDERSDLTQPSMMHQTEYQDHTVQHSDSYQPDYGSSNEPAPEPERDPANEAPENNLVNPGNEGQPLEDTMNQASQSPVPDEAPQPVVEEAADF